MKEPIKEEIKRADQFLKDIAPNLKEYVPKWVKYFNQKGWIYSDDLLQDTIIKCYNAISKNPIQDGVQKSLGYLFCSLQMNYKREQQYARVKNRSYIDNLDEEYEKYHSLDDNANIRDLWTDYQVYYLLIMAQLYFKKEYVYLLKMKYLNNWTDDQLKKKNKDYKQIIKDMITFLKQNISIDDIKADFSIKYPDIDLSEL